jgi:hypothetical protein
LRQGSAARAGSGAREAEDQIRGLQRDVQLQQMPDVIEHDPVSFRQELDGGWTLRFGPLPAVDVARALATFVY